MKEEMLTLPEGIFPGERFYNTKENCLVIRGSGMDRTILTRNAGGYDPAPVPGEEKLGTFRSYTLGIMGRKAVLSDLTIGNTSTNGQAVALLSAAEEVLAERVHLVSHQDTLFLAPLPEKEREKNGFRGPLEHERRYPTHQVFRDCVIEGDVDFIFGGADALFEHCRIISRRPGFVCAPCTPEGHTGFRFVDCSFEAEKNYPAGSVYLARPWRDGAAAVFEHCTFGEHIAPGFFTGWRCETPDPESRFAVLP